MVRKLTFCDVNDDEDASNFCFFTEESVDLPDCSIPQLLFPLLDGKYRSQVLSIDGNSGRKFTGEDIKKCSENIALSLIDLGFKEGDSVTCVVPNCSLQVCITLGVLAAGGIFSGLFYAHPEREIQYQVQDSESKAIFCYSENAMIVMKVADASPSVQMVILLDDAVNEKKYHPMCTKKVLFLQHFTAREPKSTDIHLPLANDNGDRKGYLLYSSGSTGLPKGVIKTHRNFIGAILLPHQERNIFFHHNSSSLFLCFLPIPHISGQVTLLCGLYFGATVVWKTKFEGLDDFCDSIQKHKATVTGVNTGLISLMTSQANYIKSTYDISSLVEARTSGAPMSSVTRKAFEAAFPGIRTNIWYGSTECGMVTSPPRMDLEDYETSGSVNRGHKIKIIDRETGLSVPIGQTGELCITSEEVTMGYLNRPDASIEAFTADGWFRSGDAAYVNHQGLLYITGRFKELIKVGSSQVAPAELESILLSHPKVREASVIGVPDQIHGELPKAFIVLKDPTHQSLQSKKDIMDFVNNQVGEWKRIRFLQFLPDIPKLGIGKVDKMTLKKMTI